MGKVGFEAKQGVYLTYKNYPYNSSQVFGEFVDNAIQSNTEHISVLKSMSSGHKLRVEIAIDWFLDETDKIVKARSVTIRDNAAGMTSEIFAHAFNLTDDQISRKGMNEFGVGMKAASAWLGNKWHVESTAIDDSVTRILDVDLTEITSKGLKELESQEVMDSSKSHGTTITISELWPENVIKQSMEEELVKNIASIYRYFIRNDEVQIYFGDKLLSFEEYEPLKAPSYKNPDGEVIEWKKSVAIDDLRGHTLSGFIGILNDGKGQTEKRGVVFTRNHRVVMGFDPNDRTVGKIFCGQIGSFKYRRVYGELEISGFSVAFGKNKLNDPELLEALCESAAGKLKINETNLLAQADKYRAKKVKPPVEPPLIFPTGNDSNNPSNDNSGSETQPDPPDNEPLSTDDPVVPPDPSLTPHDSTQENDTFDYCGKKYSLFVLEGSDCDELFWNDLSEIENDRLICRINYGHDFFQAYGKITEQLTLILKTMSVAMYKAKCSSSSISSMMSDFNQLLKAIRK